MDVNAEVRRLGRMAMTDLKARYEELFGERTASGNRDHLVRRIAWRLQARAEGDLSERARRRAAELADDAELRTRAPAAARPAAADLVGRVRAPGPGGDAPALSPGTVLTRRYKGRVLEVQVLEKGFEYEGRSYRSLTAIANEVTGGHWNGNLFFGLGGAAKRRAGGDGRGGAAAEAAR